MTEERKLKLGTLQTRPLNASGANDPRYEGIGVFDLPVEISRGIFFQSPDKLASCKQAISMHLAGAVQDTKVPTSYWYFVPEPRVRKEFNFPKVMSFNL